MMKTVFYSIVDFSFGFVRPELVIEKDVTVKFEPDLDYPKERDYIVGITVILYRGDEQVDCFYSGEKYLTKINGVGYSFELNRVASNTYGIAIQKEMVQ